MDIFVKNANGKTITLNIDVNATTLGIKEEIERRLNIPIKEQRIYYGGKRIEHKDGLTVTDFGIFRHATLNLL